MKNAKQIAEILKKRREEKGYSFRQVESKMQARGVKYTFTAIQKMEKGNIESIDIEVLTAFCQIYNLDYKKMLKLAGLDDDLYERFSPKETSNVSDEVFESFLQIPLYGMASAGTGLIEDFENIEELEYISIPKLNGNVKQRDFATKVKGDSMEPYYHDGDVIVIDVTNVDIRTLNGKEALIYWNEEKYLKRVFFEEGTGDLILKSYNPAYPDIKILNREIEKVECKGVISMVISMRNNRRI